MIVDKKQGALDKGMLNLKKQINAVEKYENDNVFALKTAIDSIVETLEKIYLTTALYDKYSSIFYDGNDEITNILFRNLVRQRLEYIDHPAIFTEYCLG